MKKRKQLALKKVGENYLLVDISNNNVNMTAVYSMNQTAARLWEHLDECNNGVEDLANQICMEFEVDYERAFNDIKVQLRQWQEMGLLVE